MIADKKVWFSTYTLITAVKVKILYSMNNEIVNDESNISYGFHNSYYCDKIAVSE